MVASFPSIYYRHVRCAPRLTPLHERALLPGRHEGAGMGPFAAEDFAGPVERDRVHRRPAPLLRRPRRRTRHRLPGRRRPRHLGVELDLQPDRSAPRHHGHPAAPRVPRIEPVLGLSVGGKTWVLAAKSVTSGGEVHWCTEPYHVNPKDRAKPIMLPCPKLEGVETATRHPVLGPLARGGPRLRDRRARGGLDAHVGAVRARRRGRVEHARRGLRGAAGATARPPRSSGTIAFNFPGPTTTRPAPWSSTGSSCARTSTASS